MLIAFWLTCLVLFSIGSAFLFLLLLQNPKNQDSLHTFINGFRFALKDCGFGQKRRCQVELWKWEISDEDETCEDGLERTTWPPMDIADWMKAGLPGTPEAETKCGEHCCCRLVRHIPSHQKNKGPVL